MNFDCLRNNKYDVDPKLHIRWFPAPVVATWFWDGMQQTKPQGFIAMDIANWLVAAYTSEKFIQIALVAIFFSALTGHFVHRFMGNASFGTFVNALIILCAIGVASLIDDRRIAILLPDHALRVSTVSALIATGMLIMIASFKHWLRDHI